MLKKHSAKSFRNNTWLLSRLDYLWSTYFADVPQENPLIIKFGKYSKFRLGSIKQNPLTKYSFITITGMFKNKAIPTEVVDHTIAHELVHYTHGFSSSIKRLHKYPHAGGIVKREMQSRGMGYLNNAYARWVKIYREQLEKL